MDFFGILYDMKNGKKVPYSKTYFDTLFAAKLAEMQIKTITDTLPLTFRTSETALRSWTIYGNDFQQEESKSTRLPLSFYTDEDEVRDWTIYGNNYEHKYNASGTLPLTVTTHTAGAAVDWEIEGNNGHETVPQVYTDWEQGTRNTTEQGGETYDEVKVNSNTRVRNAELIPVITPFYYEISSGYQIGATFFDENGLALGASSNIGFRSTPYIYTGVGKYVSFAIKNDAGTAITPSSDFEVKIAGSYVQGVGQRTKNLLEITANTQTISRVTFTVNKEAGTITANGTADTTVYLNLPIDAPSGNYYYSGCALGGSASTYDLYAWDNTISGRPKKWDGETNVDSDYGGTNQEIKVDSEHSMQLTIRIRSGYTCNNLVFKPMLRAADTSSDFVPFGYEIPLNVNGTTQDIYIGSTPLTAGETVSKTSTGVDIAAQVGANTITTELYNKPSMSIEGVDYVGVGEYVNGQWQIPLTVSDGTNTTTVNVPINAPLTAYDTATKTSTGVDIPSFVGTNTISTTLENKPQMEVYYGYKGAGVHVGNTWEFNFITSANGNQRLTKVTMDKPLRAGETLTSEQAGVTIPTYSGAENTLSLYPSAAGYGNPEMTITYKGG